MPIMDGYEATAYIREWEEFTHSSVMAAARHCSSIKALDYIRNNLLVPSG